MIEDLLSAVKEKDTKLRKVEQEHVQVQNDLIIKNMKLLQEREENYRKLNNRNAQIDEYKYNINDMTMKLEKLRQEIMNNEDKLIEENEMLKTRIQQENINYSVKLDSLQTEKDNLTHENAMLKKLIEEKDENQNILLIQEQQTNQLLKDEKTDAEKSLEKLSQDFKLLLLNNERLEVDLQQSEQNVVQIRDKIKNQSSKQSQENSRLEEKISAIQKESNQKSHKINFLLEKIESDCEKWNMIESDLKKEICDLHSALTEKQNLLDEKEKTILKIRSAENDRAVSLLEAVKSYVEGGESEFNYLQQNSNVSTTTVTRSMIRTVSTFNLRNGFLEENNNGRGGEALETLFETNDTDASQSSETIE